MSEKYIQKAVEEIKNPTFALTEQYLSVMELVEGDLGYEVERVDEETEADRVAVYFRVLDERFFFVVFVRKESLEISWIMIENGHKCSLNVISENHTYAELAKFTKLKPHDGWSKGDLQPRTGKARTFSLVSYEFVDSEAYDLKPLLSKVLDEIEKDAENILSLTKMAEVEISICRHQALSANAGIHFDIQTINRMAKLNLEVDIDTYIVGKAL